MIIQTKYNAGDNVWTMSNNKAVQCRCVQINIEDSKSEDDLGWILDFNEFVLSFISLRKGPPPAFRKESDLYKTKEDLIESIFKP